MGDTLPLSIDNRADGPTSELPHTVVVRMNNDQPVRDTIGAMVIMDKWLTANFGASMDRWLDGYDSAWRYCVFFASASDAFLFKCWLKDGQFLPASWDI